MKARENKTWPHAPLGPSGLPLGPGSRTLSVRCESFSLSSLYLREASPGFAVRDVGKRRLVSKLHGGPRSARCVRDRRGRLGQH